MSLDDVPSWDDLMKVAKEIAEQRDRAMQMVATAQAETKKAQDVAAHALKLLDQHMAECHR